ncbi:unnamed protein product [Macrosiphum euphorbiae]|uniref:Uncharacterized protein n=1 Tax=Macrosiphum euphorbiae TaxID=13131 RepID=A0AAV0WH86_9HEMI|nr:unnamed protein product [Macrosiphum euphorbiae]
MMDVNFSKFHQLTYQHNSKMYKRACDDYCYGNDTIDYRHDHVKVSNYYNSIKYEDIQKEVQNYGPVSAVGFLLYDDHFFFTKVVFMK